MSSLTKATEQKLRGGYYTPFNISRYITHWVSYIKPKTLLEPSCGDGIFFESIAHTRELHNTKIRGFELDTQESSKSRERCLDLDLKHAEINNQDFLSFAIHHADPYYDAIVGNPPYIRYQNLPSHFQKTCETLFDQMGIKFTKHTNAWIPFVLASLRLLNAGGRLAMVIPSELLSVSYAKALRLYLLQVASKIVVIDPKDLWFEDALQGTIILMVEKKKHASALCEGVAIVPVSGQDFMQSSPELIFNEATPCPITLLTDKWLLALLDRETIALLDTLQQHPDIYRLKELATVDVGMVTGANEFFMPSPSIVNRYQLSDWCHPGISKSEHCKGLVYDQSVFEENISADKPVQFLWLKGDVPNSVSEYLLHGEKQGYPSRYKCRIRKPWYLVPSVYPSDMLITRHAHHNAKLVLNTLQAHTTDTFMRVRSISVNAEKLVAHFINPLTALSTELEGRSYGGGVLELIPSEAERLLIPLPKNHSINLDTLNHEYLKQDIESVLRRQGHSIFGELGLSANQQEQLIQAWLKLKKRRQRIN